MEVSITNVLIAGVGGQGLVIATKILAEVAFYEGYDIKTSDVIGLSQRGGMVWGSVRFGSKVYSALIPEGEADILLAMEGLEALRWSKMLKNGANIIFNREKIYPNRVLIEKANYPQDIESLLLKQDFNILVVEAQTAAKEIGNIKVSNLILLGKLSTLLPFSNEVWLQAISENVPKSTIDLNIKAFQAGRA
jgi:indolepyruvate ferredoxin oxidoreductase, beta subunit